MKTIAVVGNGPAVSFSPGSAEKIDACDLVYRLNNYRLGDDFPFAGKKVTHWATSFAKDIEGRDVDNVWATLPLLNAGWHRGHGRFYDLNADLLFEALRSGKEFRALPWPLYCFAGRLSAGMLLLYWLYVDRGWTLEGITIEGFSFFDRNLPHHYFTGNDDGQDAHNPDVERSFFARMQRSEIR